jgi:hypothetical protein
MFDGRETGSGCGEWWTSALAHGWSKPTDACKPQAIYF